jgi:hypothetical protein
MNERDNKGMTHEDYVFQCGVRPSGSPKLRETGKITMEEWYGQCSVGPNAKGGSEPKFQARTIGG